MGERAPKTYTGSCLCGAVTFRAVDLSDIWYCHCQQCQHLTGHYISAAGVKRENFTVDGPLNWLRISDSSRSGHCADCGSYMFWDCDDRPTISVLTGSLDDTTGLEAKGHIFVDEKPDFYEITDGLPQFAQYPSVSLR